MLPATAATERELRLPRKPLYELDTPSLLSRPDSENRKSTLDGYRGNDLAFARISKAAANMLGRDPRWCPVDIEVVRKTVAVPGRLVP